MIEAVSITLALALGIAVGMLIARNRARAVETGLREQLATGERALQAQVLEAERGLQQQLAEVDKARATAEARLSEQEKAHREAQARSSATFKELAGDVLKQSSEQFLSLAKSKFEVSEKHQLGELEKRQLAISELVKPLNEKLQ